MDKNTPAENENENSSGSQPAPEGENQGAENKEGSTPAGEENKQQPQQKVPFHEDPQVQEYLNRQWEQKEKNLRESLAKDFENRFAPKKGEGEDSIPEWFGGDLKQWHAYQEYNRQMVEQAKQGAVETYQKQVQEQQGRVQEANDWFAYSISNIEGITGKKVDGNALLKYTLENNGNDNKFVDKFGRWDYFKAFKEMAAASQGTNLGDKKKLADGTMQDGGKPENEPKIFKTSQDFKKERPW